ncbi:hypothetical protein DY000_02011740 [Brassica cretica]|uniref:F-box domain-containing protein n=1 Tax=Brassica cretica TaxID=69181 RepID=A0ABQ7CLL6_BRACR|nr:hypothetical protein DY000_02011740 [Brassica cretica]
MGQATSSTAESTGRGIDLRLTPPVIVASREESMDSGNSPAASDRDYTEDLPGECLAHVFQYLGAGDRKRCSLVCKRWLFVDGQNRHRLSLDARDEIFSFLPSMFDRFDSVTKLALRCDRKSLSLSDEALVMISVRCSNLTRVKLRGCREITDLGMVEFAKNCGNLKKLSVGSCNFGAKGVNAMLENCKLLEELSVKRLRGMHEAPELVCSSSSLRSVCLKELVNGQVFEPLVANTRTLKTLKIIRCLGELNLLLCFIPLSSKLRQSDLVFLVVSAAFSVSRGRVDSGLDFCLPVEIARFVGRGPPPAELRGVARRLRRCLLGATSVVKTLSTTQAPPQSFFQILGLLWQALLVVLDEVLPVGDGVLGFEQWLGDGSFSVRSASLPGRLFSRQWGLEKLSVDSRDFESGSGVASSCVVALFLLVALCLAETEGFKTYLFSGTRWSYLAGSDVGSSFSWVWPDCLSRKASEVSWLSLPVAAPHPRLLEELKICHKSCSLDCGSWLGSPLEAFSFYSRVVSGIVSSPSCVSIAKRFSSLAARFEDVSFLWLMLMKYRLNPWIRVFSCNSPAIGSGKVIDFCRLCVEFYIAFWVACFQGELNLLLCFIPLSSKLRQSDLVFLVVSAAFSVSRGRSSSSGAPGRSQAPPSMPAWSHFGEFSTELPPAIPLFPLSCSDAARSSLFRVIKLLLYLILLPIAIKFSLVRSLKSISCGQNSLYDSSAASVLLSDLRSSLAGTPRRAVRGPPRTRVLGDGSFSVRSAFLSGRVFSRQWGLEKLSIDSRGFESGSGVASSCVVAVFLLVVLCMAENEGFKPYLFSGSLDCGSWLGSPLEAFSFYSCVISGMVSSPSCVSIAKRFSSLAARVEDVSFLWLMLMKCCEVVRSLGMQPTGFPDYMVRVRGALCSIAVGL